jgi:quercetin dioxygenase-like cupin family protein
MTIELSKLGEVFSDARGTIRNLLEQSCGGVSIIESKAGSRRSDHHHVSDGHWLYVLSGRMEYWERPVGSQDKPERVTVNQGEMIWTGPGIEHATVFPVDTVLISMSLRPRDKANHEADLIRLEKPLPVE